MIHPYPLLDVYRKAVTIHTPVKGIIPQVQYTLQQIRGLCMKLALPM